MKIKKSTWPSLPKGMLILALSLFCLVGLSGAALAADYNKYDRDRSQAPYRTHNNQDNIQLGNEIVVPAGSIAEGDTVAIFDDVTVLGEVLGDAIAIAGDVRVEGKVAGDVVSVGGRVILGDAAEVNGQVTAIGAGLERSPNAKVMGGVNNVAFGDLFHPNINLSRIRWFGFANPIGYLFYLLGLYALALLTVTLFPSQTANVADYMEKEWGRSALIGALTLLLIAPVTLLIMITVIGIPLAFLLWVGFFLAKMLGYVAAVSLLGSKIGKDAVGDNHLTRLAIGVLVLGLVRYVPVLGALTSFAVTIVTLGAVIDSKFGTNKPWLPRRKA